MPAFTFEKLSAPASQETVPTPAEKQRSTLGQLVSRLTAPRTKRDRPMNPDSDSRQTQSKSK